MKALRRIEPTVIRTVGWRTVVSKHFEMPDGQTATFDTVGTEGAGASAVIALTRDNRVIIAEQFRAGPERVMQELPGGMIDQGETPLDAAIRELGEETGYQPQDIQPLGHVYPDGYMNMTHYYFLATGCQKTTKQSLDPQEFVDVREITIEALFAAARSAQLTDVGAVFLAYDILKELQQRP